MRELTTKEISTVTGGTDCDSGTNVPVITGFVEAACEAGNLVESAVKGFFDFLADNSGNEPFDGMSNNF